MRWFSELQNPTLKCERVGHRLVRKWRRRWVSPQYGWSSVADEVREEREECSRCDDYSEGWKEKDRSSIQSLSAPSETFEKIRSGGYVVESGTVRGEAK